MKQGLNKIENPFQTVILYCLNEIQQLHLKVIFKSHLSCDFHQTAPSRTECGNNKKFVIVSYRQGCLSISSDKL